MQTTQDSSTFKFIIKLVLLEILATLPYSIGEVAVYEGTVKDFLHHIHAKDDIRAEIPTTIALGLLGLSYLFSYSQTNGKMFGYNERSTWFKIRDRARQVIGIPATFIKLAISSLAFYLTLEPFIESGPLIALSVMLCAFSILPQLTIFACPLQKKQIAHDKQPLLPINTDTFTSSEYAKQGLKYSGVHFLILFFALANAFQYLQSSLKVPQSLGFMNHPIRPQGDTSEKITYSLLSVLNFLLGISTHVTYADLAENAVGLSSNSKWDFFKRNSKRATALPTILIKVLCALAHIFSMMRGLTGNENIAASFAVSIFVSCLVAVSGAISQASIVWSDPLRSVKPQDRTDDPIIANSKKSVDLGI